MKPKKTGEIKIKDIKNAFCDYEPIDVKNTLLTRLYTGASKVKSEKQTGEYEKLERIINSIENNLNGALVLIGGLKALIRLQRDAKDKPIRGKGKKRHVREKGRSKKMVLKTR